MILRVRSCAGTWRVTVDGNVISSIKKSIFSLHGIKVSQQTLSSDPQGNMILNDNVSLEQLDIKHGDMIYLQGNVVRNPNGGFMIEKDDEDDEKPNHEEGGQSVGNIPLSSLSSSSTSSSSSSSVVDISHDQSITREDNGLMYNNTDDDVRRPDSMKHEQMIDTDSEFNHFDAIDLAMNMAASSQQQTSLYPTPSEYRNMIPIIEYGPNRSEVQNIRDNMRNILQATNPNPGNRNDDDDFIDSMASEVASLRRVHGDGDGDGNTDESLARLLQMAEAQAESTVSPELYDQYLPSSSTSPSAAPTAPVVTTSSSIPPNNMLIDDEDALNHAIQLSLSTGPPSSQQTSNTSSSSSILSSSASSTFSQELRKIEEESYQKAKNDNKLKRGAAEDESSLSSPSLDRALLARRRADQILEAARNGQPWPKATLTPLPSSSSSSSSTPTTTTPSSSSSLSSVTTNASSTTTASGIQPSNRTLNIARNAAVSSDPIPNILNTNSLDIGRQVPSSQQERMEHSMNNTVNDDMLMDMVHEDEVLASVVAASIDDIIKGDDAVTKEMDEFEQALAQSVLDQNATNRTASTTSHQSSSIRGDHDVLNDEDDELRRAIEASLSA